MSFKVQVQTLSGYRSVHTVKKEDKISDLRKQLTREGHIPYTAIKLICQGKQLQDNVTLESHGIDSFVGMQLICRWGIICITIDTDEYVNNYNHSSMYDTYLQYRYKDDENDPNESYKFNTKQLLDDCYENLNEENDEQFEELYDIFWNGEILKDTTIDNKYLEYASPHWMGPWSQWHYANPFALKTKDGELLYMEHKRQIHDHKCMLLVIGYTKKVEQKYKFKAPTEIKSVIKVYLNKNDIQFKSCKDT